ncbi:MAG: glycosyltransferase [Candidatus Aminicenantes bacterium]
MKVLLVNKFFFLKGGSETSLFDTAALLEKRGHAVSFFSMEHPANRESQYAKYFVSNVDYDNPSSFSEKLKASIRILYSWEARKKLDRLLEKERPDIVHLHNIHHQISPSILHTLKKKDLPVALTLHDYKMVCPVYTLMRNGRPCEKCRHKRFYHCTTGLCCKGSFAKSLLNTLEMYLHHKWLHVYDLVDVFLSPSEFLRNKLLEMGFKGRIVHLPNVIDTAGFDPSYSWKEEHIVYFGRLSKEKGLYTLLQAAQGLPVECRIFGEGPERERLLQWIAEKKMDNVHLCGHVSQEKLKEEVRKAMFVVLPSEWYENNPLSVLEAFALGKPVVGARIGGIPELVRDEETGLTFEPGNAAELKKNILYLLDDSEKIMSLGKKARQHVERNNAPELHFQKLMNIYSTAKDNH